MRKSVWLVLVAGLLVAGLWLAPVRIVTAQETAETAETENEGAQGAGPFILLIGIGALAMVGAIYASQQASSAKKEVE